MVISTVDSNSYKQIMKVYSARAYTKNDQCYGTVEVNLPEYLPALPKDSRTENVGLSNTLFANSNYPTTSSVVKVSHYLALPVLRSSYCPRTFNKNTPFLLFNPTGKYEDGYLMYI